MTHYEIKNAFSSFYEDAVVLSLVNVGTEALAALVLQSTTVFLVYYNIQQRMAVTRKLEEVTQGGTLFIM